MQNPRVAFVPLARTTFDIPLATQVSDALSAQLEAAGLTLTGPSGLVTDLTAAQKVADEIAADPPDLLLVFQATFADSTMVKALAESIDAPLFLWAVPEEPTGGRLRLNSLCGVNLAGHALTLQGRRYQYAYAAPDDGKALAQVKALATAAKIRSRLRKTRLGVVGEHPVGLDTCHLDAPLLNSHLGVQIVSIDLGDVFNRAQAWRDRDVSPGDDLAAIHAQLDLQLDNLDTLDQSSLRGTLSVYAALKQIAEEQELDGLAVRCWPEFFTEMGCAACGAMSMISDGFGSSTQIPCSCEADINGTITQLILQWLSGGPAFGSDLVTVDFEEDVAVLWHCGLAPLSMADPTVKPQGGLHSNRGVPLVMEFPLKPGRVTVARLSRATGDLRLVVGGGEMLSMDPSFSGTSGVLRFDRPANEILDIILGEGLEHHLSLTYGDHLEELYSLARTLDLQILSLT